MQLYILTLDHLFRNQFDLKTFSRSSVTSQWFATSAPGISCLSESYNNSYKSLGILLRYHPFLQTPVSSRVVKLAHV